MTQPNPKNSCGGGFPDWLEVNLLPQCNANCVWCVEAKGFKPTEVVSWEILTGLMIGRPEKNIMLLGGEPTLHKHLGDIVTRLRLNGKLPWVTTNGSMLSKEYVMRNLRDLEGLNISIHHHDLEINRRITGVSVHERNLGWACESLEGYGVRVRANCNIIRGYIDSMDGVDSYIQTLKSLGISNFRFAELKESAHLFVSLTNIFPDHAVDDPFTQGCSVDFEYEGANVNIRQMCGLHTSHRTPPENPCQVVRDVLYYNGEFYKGWQLAPIDLREKSTEGLLDLLESGDITKDVVLSEIAKRATPPEKEIIYVSTGGSDCGY